jgi:hypothetical protein
MVEENEIDRQIKANMPPLGEPAPIVVPPTPDAPDDEAQGGHVVDPAILQAPSPVAAQAPASQTPGASGTEVAALRRDMANLTEIVRAIAAFPKNEQFADQRNDRDSLLGENSMDFGRPYGYGDQNAARLGPIQTMPNGPRSTPYESRIVSREVGVTGDASITVTVNKTNPSYDDLYELAVNVGGITGMTGPQGPMGPNNTGGYGFVPIDGAIRWYGNVDKPGDLWETGGTGKGGTRVLGWFLIVEDGYFYYGYGTDALGTQTAAQGAIADHAAHLHTHGTASHGHEEDLYTVDAGSAQTVNKTVGNPTGSATANTSEAAAMTHTISTEILPKRMAIAWIKRIA